jgi:protein-tyrosine phosphatase
VDRHLDWEGCFNARDLGGLRTREGRATRFGRIMRADSLDGLSEAGWAALVAAGVRTVVDLRNDDEIAHDAARRPAEVATVRVPLDVTDDREFWSIWGSGPQFGTPLYYRPHLERFPERSAAAVAAIARARPGAVVVHCSAGRDRSGQVSLLVLALAGVEPEEIAADYALSAARLAARAEALGHGNQGPMLEAFLAERGTTATTLVAELAADSDLEACLRGGGLTAVDVAAVRKRLLG